MALPSNMGTCLVIGTFIRAVIDTADPDRDPDSLPIEGMTARFTASASTVRNLSAVPPVTIILDPIECTTDASGQLLGPDGTPGIRLVASNDADLDPTGWTYTVSLSATSMPTLSFSFVAPVGGTVDLSTVVPVSASPGTDLIEWQAAVLATEAARDDVLGAIPAGGSTGQVLAKASAADLDTEWVTGGGGGGAAWGGITGTLSSQTDLNTALNAKAPTASPTFTGTVSGVTKTHVGLGNVDNTSDASKPVSSAQLTALNLKANLASPTFTGTVSGVTKTHVGLGNVDNTADTAKPVSTAQQTALDLKANLASPTFTGTVSGVTKTHVGLGNVDNTSDANKPVSTAQQTAIDAQRGLYVGINAQTGTTYAPVLTDQGKLVTCTNAGAITVTLPANATTAFPIGTQVDFAVLGAGMVTFVAGGGATVNGTPSLVTRAQYSAVTLIKVSTNGWLAVGDLA